MIFIFSVLSFFYSLEETYATDSKVFVFKSNLAIEKLSDLGPTLQQSC